MLAAEAVEFYSAADFMMGNARSEPDLYEIRVLRCNWRTVQLFQRCKLAFLAGGMGAHCLGIEAAELQAVLTMSGEPARRWPVLSRHILEMGAAAAKYINDETRKEAEKQRKKR